MTYEMMCPKCKKRIEVSCKMDDYDNVIPFLSCEECKEKLIRAPFKPEFVIGTTGGYDSVVGKAKWQS